MIKVKTVNTGNTNPSPTSFAFTETLWQGSKKVGNDAIQLTPNAPQWNVLRLAPATQPKETFGDVVPARVRVRG